MEVFQKNYAANEGFIKFEVVQRKVEKNCVKFYLNQLYESCTFLQAKYLTRNTQAKSVDAIKQLDDLLVQLGVRIYPSWKQT